jgi:hypothetical protein
MTVSIVPAFLRPAVLERVAEGWPADRIAAWLGEKYGLQVTGSDVLRTLKQANAERGAVAQAIIRDHMRAELPMVLSELGDLRSRAKRYETEAHAARDWTAVRGFMAEERNAIALALRYSGAADPEEPSAEARAEVERELSKALDALQRGLDAETFKRVALLVIEMGKTGGGELPGPR